MKRLNLVVCLFFFYSSSLFSMHRLSSRIKYGTALCALMLTVRTLEWTKLQPIKKLDTWMKKPIKDDDMIVLSLTKN